MPGSSTLNAVNNGRNGPLYIVTDGNTGGNHWAREKNIGNFKNHVEMDVLYATYWAKSTQGRAQYMRFLRYYLSVQYHFWTDKRTVTTLLYSREIYQNGHREQGALKS